MTAVGRVEQATFEERRQNETIQFERNRIVDSGGEKGVAIDVTGETEAVTFVKNEIRETRKPLSRIGIRVGAETKDIRFEDNKIEGIAMPVSDLRRK